MLDISEIQNVYHECIKCMTTIVDASWELFLKEEYYMLYRIKHEV